MRVASSRIVGTSKGKEMGREKHPRFATIITLLLIGALLLPTSFARARPEPQPSFPEGDFRYFDQTGHYVRGPFLTFFDTRGGLRIFGYPQTEYFYDADLGLYVQYFDNARMEWHPNNPQPYKVQLGLLGEIMGHRQPPLPRDEWQPNSRYRRVFPETGHMVSFAFLDFYDNNGGLDIFGYPISETMVEGEFIVQYFQRMRLEWHPERAREDRVVIGALGNEYIYRYGVPQEYQRRQPPPPIREPSTPDARATQAGGDKPSLRVWAAVRHAITGRDGTQTIFVYVTNSSRQAIQGADVTVLVRYPSEEITYDLPGTDAQGITSVTFDINSPPPGRRVIVEVAVDYEGATATAQTFFLPWW